MVIRTPRAPPSDPPAARAHALTVRRLRRELLADPALGQGLAAAPAARLATLIAALRKGDSCGHSL